MLRILPLVLVSEWRPGVESRFWHHVVLGGVQHIQHTSAFDKHAWNNWRSLPHMLTVHWFPWGCMRMITLQALIAMCTRWLLQSTINYSGAISTLASGCFWGFKKKKRLNACGFVWEYLCSCTGYWTGRSVKRRGKSSSLHSKKIFLLGGCGFFVSDVISGGLLGHLGPLWLALGTNR